MNPDKIRKGITSVITITFNNYDELLATLSSTEGIEEIERIVINGGQCQETRNFLIKSGIKHISEKDNGIADAFNKGFHLSSGEFVYFLNSGDTLVKPDYISQAVQIFNSNPRIDYIHSGIIFEDYIIGKRNIFAERDNFALRVPFLHPTLITRRSVFDRVGIFDENFEIAMDYELSLRMLRHGMIGHGFPSQIVAKMKGGGISASRERIVLIESLKALKKNGYFGPKVIWGIGGKFARLAVKKIIGNNGKRFLFKYLEKLGLMK